MTIIDQTLGAGGLVTTTTVKDNEMRVNYVQDVEPMFESVKDMRNSGEAWKQGVKKDMVHAFHIPDVVVMELWNIGVNVYQAPFKDVVWGLKRLGRYEACDMTGKKVV